MSRDEPASSPECVCFADEKQMEHATYCPREGMDYDPPPNSVSSQSADAGEVAAPEQWRAPKRIWLQEKNQTDTWGFAFKREPSCDKDVEYIRADSARQQAPAEIELHDEMEREAMRLTINELEAERDSLRRPVADVRR